MHCQLHPGIAAANSCQGCGASFCENCLVKIRGACFCAGCKHNVLAAGDAAVTATVPCKEAKQALTASIVGLFVLGIVLEPWAIQQALKARTMMRENPELSGEGKATAALVIGIIGLVGWAVGMFLRFSEIGAST